MSLGHPLSFRRVCLSNLLRIHSLLRRRSIRLTSCSKTLQARYCIVKHCCFSSSPSSSHCNDDDVGGGGVGDIKLAYMWERDSMQHANIIQVWMVPTDFYLMSINCLLVVLTTWSFWFINKAEYTKQISTAKMPFDRNQHGLVIKYPWPTTWLIYPISLSAPPCFCHPVSVLVPPYTALLGVPPLPCNHTVP